MVAVAIVVYINNVIVFPGLRAHDGFGHFTYIWSLASTGTVPLATEGWSFFHPPVYYAFMASVWRLLSALDPVVRLKVGTGLIALLGIAQSGIAYLVVKRCLPDSRYAQLLAIGLILFLPVHMFTAGYLGNERLSAAICGLSLLVLLWTLDRPHWSRVIVLGLLLGLSLLVKFTALAIVAASFATIFFSFYSRREFSAGLKILAILAVTVLSVCGWFYVRSISLYGTPFMMSRDTEMVKRVENLQAVGKRTPLEYLLFDPLIIVDPQWPRGVPISGVLSQDVVRSSIRESVWTGVYANAWFDGYGGQVLPMISQSSASLYSGRLILALALIPTGLVLIGIGVTIVRLWRTGWSDVYGAMLISFVAMITVFVYGTTMVPLNGAIKATYLTPVSVIFAFWLAIGFDAVYQFHKKSARAVLAVCAVLGVVNVVVFSLGAVVGRGYLIDGLNNRVWENLYGVVSYAGGDRVRARESFKASAKGGWHLGYENIAAMALEEGRPRAAVRYLRVAAKLQPQQSFGLPADRKEFDDAAAAEYQNSLAVAYHRIGLPEKALTAAVVAVSRHQGIPEAHYNLGVLKLIKWLSLHADQVGNRELVEEALGHFRVALTVDPNFPEATSMIGVAEALLGDCERARLSFEKAVAVRLDGARLYPLETGTGDMHSAGINRRQRIQTLPESLTSDYQQTKCLVSGG